jgi:hypothetical protein
MHAEHDKPRTERHFSWWRTLRVLALALGGVLSFVALMIGPLWLWKLPRTFHRHPMEWSALAIILTYATLRVLAARDPDRSSLGAWAQRTARRVEAIADWALRGGLAWAVAGFDLALWLTWMPHYLTWPWCRDADTFAVLAQSWDAGIRPYRDILAYNFPGQTYLFWVLGRLAGWGRTPALFVFDAACVLLLGVALAVWSRRRLGGTLPGLVGYSAFLLVYLSLPYELVAQRDWYTALSVALAMMALEAWPGRRGRLIAALMTAWALAIRPHAVLFLPALISAIDEGARRLGDGWASTLRALRLWFFTMISCFTIIFAPLIVQGLVPDFLRNLRIVAYGGPYSRNTPEGAWRVFAAQFGDWRADVVFVLIIVMTIFPSSAWRRLARTWMLAWLGALSYKPVHPIPHAYLSLPISLFSTISLALPLGLLAASWSLASPFRVIVVVLALYEAVPVIPRFCRVQECARAVPALVRGEEPEISPVGSEQVYQRGRLRPSSWDHYCSLLRYLRVQTTPRTFVANAVNRYPFDSLNGPTGRLSPFLAESGVCWMCWVNIDLDAKFAQALERATDAVVVWSPHPAESPPDPRVKLDRVTAVILRDFEPEARFGDLEVWRRKGPRKSDPRFDPPR